jgi:CheY-like chemotaxis protein
MPWRRTATEIPMTDTETLLTLLAVAAFGAAVGVAAGLAAAGARDRLRRRVRDPGGDEATAAHAIAPSPWTHRSDAGSAARRQVGEPALAADVLVVDDSAVARTKLRRLLEGQGYSVHLANDGVEALARLEQGRYALMISDLEMPNMDGVTLINTCLGRPQSSTMPILAISGHENLRARFNACHDICGVHRKPWVDDVLTSHVATLVGTRPPPPPRRRATSAPATTESRLAA